MTSPQGITFDRVTRRYGPVLGLNDVSLAVGPGITGLIGPNGAGKTTFLNLAVGLHFPSSGTVSLLGQDPFDTPSVRGRIGYCPDGERAWDWMSGREFVVNLGQWCGLSFDTATSRAADLLAALKMGDAADKPIASYSRGMRQKVKVAQAMVHQPDLLVLDEPLNGVDPLSRHHILQMLMQEAKRGASVLISSHVLHELDGFVNEVILLQRGRLLASGTISSIRELLDEHPHSVRLVANSARALGKVLAGLKGTVSLSFPDGDNLLEVRTSNPTELYGALPQLIRESGAMVHELYPTDNDLESVFKYLVKGGGG